MRGSGGKVVVDPVHGLMEFDGPFTLLIQLLESPELQRLRRIRQLGLAYLVYPGAEHTRLPHVLGTAHTMGRVMARLQKEAERLLPAELRPDIESARDACLAALFHDLGHGPMSHAFENVVLKNWNRQAWVRACGLDGVDWIPSDIPWHVLITIALLANEDGDLHRRLERYARGLSTRVSQLIVGTYHLPYLPSLLSGEFDVDRYDYVLRDSRYTGVRQSFDREWLLDSLTFAEHPDRANEIVIALDGTRGTHGIEQLLRNRLMLYRRVYKHKTVRAAELLLGSFLERLQFLIREDQIRLSRPGFQSRLSSLLRGETLTPSELLSLDDFRMWSLILDLADQRSIDPTLQALSRMLAGRVLPKQLRAPQAVFSRLRLSGNLHQQLDELVARSISGESRFFWMHEEVKFELLNRHARTGCWMITGRGHNPRVQHLRDVRAFQGEIEPQHEYRVYVPHEAVAEGMKMLDGGE